MTPQEPRRGPSPLIPLLLVGGLLLTGFAMMVAVAVWLNSGPGWQVSATNRPDAVLVEAFIGDAPAPKFSVLLEGRSIPRDVARATPQKFDSEVFKELHFDPTISPGYWAFEIDGVPVGVVSTWMRVGDLTGEDLVIERGGSARYPGLDDREDEPPATPNP